MTAFQNYLRFERQLSEVTIQNYLFYMKKFQRFIAKNVMTPDIEKVRQEDITNFLSQLQSEGISKSSMALYIIALRCYYKWAYYFFKDEALGQVSFFLSHIIKVKRDSKIPIVPTKEEVSKLRHVLHQFLQLNAWNKQSRPYKDTLKAYAIIELLVTAGLRSKELRGLQRKDVDLENKIMLVKKGKGGYQRISLFGESAVDILKEYFAIYSFTPEDMIFPMSQYNMINRTIKLWAAKAQINPKIHPHSFRHFFITESNKNGVPLEVIADQVGHRDLNSTRHYTHLDIGYIKEKYRRISI